MAAMIVKESNISKDIGEDAELRFKPNFFCLGLIRFAFLSPIFLFDLISLLYNGGPILIAFALFLACSVFLFFFILIEWACTIYKYRHSSIYTRKFGSIKFSSRYFISYSERELDYSEIESIIYKTHINRLTTVRFVFRRHGRSTSKIEILNVKSIFKVGILEIDYGPRDIHLFGVRNFDFILSRIQDFQAGAELPRIDSI